MPDKEKEKVSKDIEVMIRAVCFDYEQWLRDRIKELAKISRGEKIR